MVANSIGVFSVFKPIRNPILHSLHHIFYFLVIVSTLFSIGFSFYIQSLSYSHLGLLFLMTLLPFFRKGGREHRLIGVLSFFCAIIPLILKYFN